MPENLLAAYYDERIRALASLVEDAPDDDTRQVYCDLLDRYQLDRLKLTLREAAYEHDDHVR